MSFEVPSGLKPTDPLEDQVAFWKEQARKYLGVHERNYYLSRENEELNGRILTLEDELETVKDYLRLVREERDMLKFQRDHSSEQVHRLNKELDAERKKDRDSEER